MAENPAEDFIADIPLTSMGRSQGRTIDEGEVGVLTCLTWTIEDIHSNREFSKTAEFGDIILGEPVVLALASGLFATAEFYRVFRKKYRVKMIAALGVEADYLKPLYPGDTIWVETSVESTRMSNSRPGSAVIMFADDVFNQHGDVIMKMKRPLLMVRDEDA
jgi:itaconyl-CoA hydratase